MTFISVQTGHGFGTFLMWTSLTPMATNGAPPRPSNIPWQLCLHVLDARFTVDTIAKTTVLTIVDKWMHLLKSMSGIWEQ